MTDPEPVVPQQRVLTLQIIVGALLTGVTAFLVIVLAIVLGGNVPARGGLPMMALIAVAVMAVNATLAVALPGFMTQRAVQQIATGTWAPPPNVNPADVATDAAKLLLVRQTTLLVAAALLEAAGFLGCIAFLLEQQYFALAVVGAVLIGLLALFPTAGTVRAWLERQLARIDELRLRGEIAPER